MPPSQQVSSWNYRLTRLALVNCKCCYCEAIALRSNKSSATKCRLHVEHEKNPPLHHSLQSFKLPLEAHKLCVWRYTWWIFMAWAAARNAKHQLESMAQHNWTPVQREKCVVWREKSCSTTPAIDGWMNQKRYHLECLVPTVKFGGGGTIVWGCLQKAPQFKWKAFLLLQDTKTFQLYGISFSVLS